MSHQQPNQQPVALTWRWPSWGTRAQGVAEAPASAYPSWSGVQQKRVWHTGHRTWMTGSCQTTTFISQLRSTITAIREQNSPWHLHEHPQKPLVPKALCYRAITAQTWKRWRCLFTSQELAADKATWSSNLPQSTGGISLIQQVD